MGNGKQLVRDFLDAAARRDHEAMARMLHPEVCVSEAASLPFGGEHIGVEAFHALVRRVFLSWRDTRLEIEQLIAEDEQVVVIARMRARSRNSDAELDMPIAELWSLEDGRIRSIKPFYHDTHAMLQLLGDVPAPSP
jgi:uncharacterized protein